MFKFFGGRRAAQQQELVEAAERARLRQANAELAELRLLASFSDEERAIMAEYRSAKNEWEGRAMTNAAGRTSAELMLMDYEYQQATQRYMNALCRYNQIMQTPRTIAAPVN